TSVAPRRTEVRPYDHAWGNVSQCRGRSALLRSVEMPFRRVAHLDARWKVLAPAARHGVGHVGAAEELVGESRLQPRVDGYGRRVADVMAHDARRGGM